MATGPGTPERIAHRGVPRQRTENTLPGFLLALEYGADAVELDVHCTADGVVVVHHDFDVAGAAIASQGWAELRMVALPGDARIPTLQDVLDAIGDRATVYVELKGHGIEVAVLDVLRQYGRRCAVHSFDHGMIARCVRAAPEVPRGALLDRNVEAPIQALGAAVARTKPRDVWPHHSLVTEPFMDAARAHGVRIIPWTVNDPADASRLTDLGVAGICTDDVRILGRA